MIFFVTVLNLNVRCTWSYLVWGGEIWLLESLSLWEKKREIKHDTVSWEKMIHRLELLKRYFVSAWETRSTLWETCEQSHLMWDLTWASKEAFLQSHAICLPFVMFSEKHEPYTKCRGEKSKRVHDLCISAHLSRSLSKLLKQTQSSVENQWQQSFVPHVCLWFSL